MLRKFLFDYFASRAFEKSCVDFKLVSLNVGGIRSSTKRFGLFCWLGERNYGIAFCKKLTALMILKVSGGHNGKVSYIFHTVLITVVG